MKNTGNLYRSTEKTPTVFLEFRDLLPPLSQEQRAALEKDILLNGCYAPVIVDQELRIVDGHNRQAICQCHGLPYTMLVFEFKDALEAKQWALDTQKGRRNLDNWELGKIALKLKPDVEARAKKNMSAGGQAFHPGNVTKEGMATLPMVPFLASRTALSSEIFRLEPLTMMQEESVWNSAPELIFSSPPLCRWQNTPNRPEFTTLPFLNSATPLPKLIRAAV